jgi:hypothetical protein
MNDELVTANAAVVSKLLVIAPFSADSSYSHSGVETGEEPRLIRSAGRDSANLLCRTQSVPNRLSSNEPDQIAKAVITSAAFACSDAWRYLVPGIGILFTTPQIPDRRVAAVACANIEF